MISIWKYKLNKINKTNLRSAGWWLFLLLILLLPNYSYYANSDEGVVLAGAWNLFNGQKIFVDFFSFIPPGSFYLVCAIWKLFAPNYLLTKFLSLLLIYLSAIGTYFIAKTIQKNKYALIAPTLFVLASFSWQAINHNTYNIFFIVWATYFFIKATLEGRNRYLVASGLLSGAATLFLQQKGVMTILVFMSWLLVVAFFKKNKASWLNLFYFVITSLIPLSFLLLMAPIQELYKNLIIFPLFNYAESNRMPLTLFAIVLILAIAVFLLLLKKQRNQQLLLLFYLQIALLLLTLPRPDWLHLSIVLFPLLAITPAFFQTIKMSAATNKSLLTIPVILLSLLFIAAAANNIWSFPPFYFFNQSEMIKYLEDNCQKSKYLYVGPFLPGLYFTTRKLPATPFSVLITNQQTNEQFETAVEYLKKNSPECAVVNYEIVKKFKHNLNNPVDQYLIDNYRPVKIINDSIIYKTRTY